MTDLSPGIAVAGRPANEAVPMRRYAESTKKISESTKKISMRAKTVSSRTGATHPRRCRSALDSPPTTSQEAGRTRIEMTAANAREGARLGKYTDREARIQGSANIGQDLGQTIYSIQVSGTPSRRPAGIQASCFET